MKYVDSIRRAGRSLRNAKGRTILTALAIAVGAFTLTLAIAAGTGARQYADDLIASNIDPQSLFVAKDGEMFGEGGANMSSGLREYSESSTNYGGMSLKALSQDDIDRIADLDSVESVTPTYIVSAQYVEFEGIDQKYTTDITAYDPYVRAEAAAGSLPNLGDKLGDKDIVLPESYADTLGKTPQELVGTTITLSLVRSSTQPTQEEIEQILASEGPAGLEGLMDVESREVEFTVRAVTARSATALITSSGLFIDDGSARELSEFLTEGTEQYQRYVAAAVIAKADVDTESVKSEIEELGLAARTAEDLQELLFTIVNLLQGIVTGFGILALIASVFGIINTQYISVLERTREIGLMKALGMRGRHVSRMFQLEAAWIGLLGGALGAIFGWGVGTLINPWLSQTIGIGDNRLLVFELLPILGLIVALILIAMLAGWFPARKAAKLDPIEALRTE